MEWGAWITLGVGLVGMSVTFIGTAIKMTWWLGEKLDAITKIGDERHAENRERFARIEEVIRKNGHSSRKGR